MSTFVDSPLKIELIGTGEQSGLWGTTTNVNWKAIQEAITGSATISFSSADVTLNLTDVNTTQAARNLRLVCTGTAGGARQLILGDDCQIDKLYLVKNAFDDDYSVTVINSDGAGGTSGTGVEIANGAQAFVFNDGTNVVSASIIDLTSDVIGILPVANGGTGISSLGSGVATWLGTPSSANLAAAVTGETGSGALVFGTSPTLSTPTLTTPVVNRGVINTTREVVTVSATAATSTVNFDTITQSVLYYTTNASGNWTLNIRGDGSTSLDSIMSTGQSMTVAFLVTQGATAYYQTGFQIDGASVTPKWQAAVTPSAGSPSSIDVYVFSIVKTGSATFTVFGSQTRFA